MGEIAGRTYGGGTPKTSIMEYWDGYIPWIQSSNLMEHELFNVDIQKHITDDGLKKSAAQLVPPNSVAVVSHVGVGKLAFMPFQLTLFPIASKSFKSNFWNFHPILWKHFLKHIFF